MSDTQTPAEALPEGVTVAPLSEQLRLEAAVVNSFAVENNKPAMVARLELYASMAEQLETTLARAVEDADLFRWMQANCYFNEHDSRDWPHVVVKVCVGTLADGRIGTYLVGPENRVGIVALDVAVRQAMAAAQDAARREMA